VTTAIFANGEYEDDAYYQERFARATRVIAADGGYAFLHRHGLTPEALVGDFDSLPEDLVAAADAAGVAIVRRPARKDQTDTELAVAEALERGARAIELLGALGGRPDHLLGHVAVLRGLELRGVPAWIASPRLVLRVFWAPTSVTLDAPPGVVVSFQSLAPTSVLTLRGLEYAVTNAPLAAESCLGLSNVVAAGPEPARFVLKAGVIIATVWDGDERFGRRA
jgi:thiamine pyrophosphokinase